MDPVQSPPVPDPLTGLLEDLFRQGWAVAGGFFEPALIEALAGELQALEAADRLRAARIGRGEARRLARRVRGDRIHWLDGGSEAQRCFLARMESLRRAVNRRLLLGLFDFECHYALYPPGARYAKHYDNFAGGGPRRLSTVAYLNRRWRPGDGGLLRIYDPDAPLRVIAEVEPRAGTLVCFLSERFPHEVTEARAPRASVVGWFRERAGLPLG